MKKLITFSYVCVLISIALSSCGPNASIVKRHYTKGYYVDWGRSKYGSTISKKENTSVRTDSKISLAAVSVKEVGNILPLNTTIPITNKVVSTGRIEHYKALAATAAKQMPNQNISTSQNPSTANEKLLYQAGSEYHGDDEGARAALSLLWIVIIVILILWLIGILAGGFGLGGLVNLLLVIALILLILWLLRVM